MKLFLLSFSFHFAELKLQKAIIKPTSVTAAVKAEKMKYNFRCGLDISQSLLSNVGRC